MKKIIVIIIGIFTFFAFVQADKHIMGKPESLESKLFAEHYVVFHISNDDLFTQKLVLNNVQNLLKHYGIDEIAIEIVALGQGLRLLLNDSEQRQRIKSLASSGVIFSACGNTMNKMKVKKSDLISVAQIVPTGVARIVELQEGGWSYIRP